LSARLPALEAAAELALKVDEVLLGRRYAEEALACARATEDPLAVARALLALGTAARLLGDAVERDTLYAEGFDRAREGGDLVLAARFVANLGTAALDEGDLERARRFYAESLALSERAASDQGVARASTFMAAVELRSGDLAEALALYRRGLGLAYRLGWTEAVVYQLGGLACAYAELGQGERAARLLGAESELVQRMHLWLERYERDLRERAASELRAQLDPERLSRLLDDGRAMALDDVVLLALGADA
jgi:tetratricopeptide (TPR) repeat protein